jgi:hypothetical protein
VYSEPPDRQLYVGREAPFTFFGGGQDPAPKMRMVWRLIFDEAALIGAGEYTYQGEHQYHGVVLARIVAGKIATWREYRYHSDLD